MLNIFSVRDAKSELYSNPVVVRTKGEAIRSFIDQVNSKDTAIGQHPEDYALFLIGQYDEETGILIPAVQLEKLGDAINFVKSAE